AHEEHPHELVAEARPAREVGGPVAGVHVAHAHEVRGAREGEHAPDPVAGRGHRDGAVDLGERAGLDLGVHPRLFVHSSGTPRTPSLPVTIRWPPTSISRTSSTGWTSRTRTGAPGTRPASFQRAMRVPSASRISRTVAREPRGSEASGTSRRR